ncbi:MAG: alpha-1,4-glucan--maltose-1-phosphate maltosyltransferase [Chloroflexota bacterium]|nr:alpha-1,4-glucan--maltose-1-phosphate maltosyltransferase [Chloroflexota bacterium]
MITRVGIGVGDAVAVAVGDGEAVGDAEGEASDGVAEVDAEADAEVVEEALGLPVGELQAARMTAVKAAAAIRLIGWGEATMSRQTTPTWPGCSNRLRIARPLPDAVRLRPRPMTTARSNLKRAAGAAPSALEPTPDAIGTRRAIVIEAVDPELDCGQYPVKRVVGDDLRVTADIFADGHDLLDGVLLLRGEEQSAWTEAPVRLIDNDRWSGTVRLTRTGAHRYTIEAWRDAIGTWHEAITKKLAAAQPVATELTEGRALLEAALARSRGSDARLIADALAREGRARTERTRAAALGRMDAIQAARRHPDRGAATRYRLELPLTVDRERARFSAWYELFPRSQGRDPARPTATTLRDAEWRLPQISAMGFDVVYLPPVHPIGRTNRKGRNNSTTARRADPGSPWAIGRDGGGHTAVASELGGIAAFEHFRRAAEARGLEVALDLALQASPDHPWVDEHPEWFSHAPDGSIKYAENPPKKYEDIYPFDFAGADAGDREALWRAWLEVVLTWVERGVRIFRVDNPHTKPIAFWHWLIAEVQRSHPEVIFLSEAFTRPKRMRALARAGFSQSYTYFVWRETAQELREYLTELTQTEMREYFRGNLWPNTPDINPHHLDAGRPAFIVRAVLAATLSSSWGIYSGFELCEQGRLDDREEYRHSEKYEIRARDWDAPGNIRTLIGGLNRLRREWRALQLYDNLRFENVTGARALFYRKALPDGTVDPLTGFPGRWRDPVYVAVNCDPTRAERAVLHPDLPAIGIGWDEPYRMIDLLTGRSRQRRGADIAVELEPARLPYRIFTIRPIAGAAGA